MKNFTIAGMISIFMIGAGASLALAQISTQEINVDIVQMISAINQNVIGLAQLAENKNIDQPVIDYARIIDIENNEAVSEAAGLSQQLEIAPTKDLRQLVKLQAEGSDDISRLAPLDQDSFSREFISDIIERYGQALTWLYTQNTDNDQVKRLIDDTKERLMHQLKRAHQLEANVLR